MTSAKHKPPPTPAAVPMQQEIDPEIRAKDEAKKRRMIAAAGRGGTILTGTLGEPNISYAKLLGRTAA